MVNEDQDLQIIDLTVGQGAEVKQGSIILAHYTGTLLNGEKFDSSYEHGQPIKVSVGAGQVLQGWDKGLLGMKKGGKRKLVIPPHLGYGEMDIPGIPANSTLVFVIELIEISENY